MNIKDSFLALLFVGLILMVSMQTSCKKDDEVATDTGLKLSFSTDTIIFDTVFSTLGSAIRELHIYNTHDEPIEISEIYLDGTDSDQFSINADGLSGTSISNVRIEANDSIYLFATVTINPNDDANPFFVGCDIVFETNSNIQTVDLVAYGQNAHYITPNLPEGSPFYSLVSGTWEDDLPYVIYGYAVVDSLESLTISQGCRLHFHDDALLWIYNSASLKVMGEPDSVVTFTNDRLESFYKDLPGQWRGIYLSEGSYDNEIYHAVIKNADLGIQCDRYGESSNPTLLIDGCEIYNMTIGGLAGNGTSITAQNMVIGNCGEYGVSLNGGHYDFRQITIGNYPNATRSTPSFIATNYFYMLLGEEWVQAIVDPSTLYLGNAIIYGNSEDEIGFEQLDDGPNFTYNLENCFVRSMLDLSSEEHFLNCTRNVDPLFANYELNNYQLDSLSPARKKGADLGVLYDILGNERPAETPDLGAYQMDFGDK